jgi:hypothetical protein
LHVAVSQIRVVSTRTQVGAPVRITKQTAQMSHSRDANRARARNRFSTTEPTLTHQEDRIHSKSAHDTASIQPKSQRNATNQGTEYDEAKGSDEKDREMSSPVAYCAGARN